MASVLEAPYQACELTRAVSELNLAFNESKPRARVHYTRTELLSLSPKPKLNGDGGEHDSVLEMVATGLTTPAEGYLIPPPPTPDDVPRPESEAEFSDTGAVEAVEKKRKKKKKKKSSGKNKKPNPTGFEEFYADGPITPTEHLEESDLYSASRPFAERIQTCIQRYRARRKLDEFKTNVFNKYLMLGGIEVSPKAFTGGQLDQETLEHATAAEIAAIQAMDFVRSGTKNSKYYDPTDSEHWVVDFEGVAKGFFSHRYPKTIGAENEEKIKLAARIIHNFLSYIHQHAVCPEYTEDVMAARKVCEMAATELWAIKQLRGKFPGDFNVAASTIFGGFYQATGITSQCESKDENEKVSVNPGHQEEAARCIFRAGIDFKGDNHLVAPFEDAVKRNDELQIVKTENKSYEVVGIELSNNKTIAADNKEAVSIKSLGMLKVKAWEGPKFFPEDFSDDEGPETNINDKLIEEFRLEDDILQLIFKGLKLELVVHQTSIGIKFFDRLLGIYCSFFTYLENEKMSHWKEPVPNERPGPTVDDPDVEEGAMEGVDGDGELAEEEPNASRK